MAIRAPIGGAGLRGMKAGKEQLKSRTKKNLSQSINLTSMVDFMSVVVIFLLMNFSTSGDAMFTQPDLSLPEATVGEDVVRVPVITVTKNSVTLEGKTVADSPKLLETEKEVGLEKLIDALFREKETFKDLHPGEPFDGKIIIAADEGIPYKLVRRVFDVAAKSGYVRVNYVIRLASKRPPQ